MKTFTRMDPERFDALVGRFSRQRIAVLGDYFLDKYLEIDSRLAEISVETGKPAHQVVAVRHSPGAAGTVVSNLAALGAGRLYAVGFTGDDGEAYELRRDLCSLGCEIEHLHCEPERRTPTYLKPRDIVTPGLAGEGSRYDTKNRQPTPSGTVERILGSLAWLFGETSRAADCESPPDQPDDRLDVETDTGPRIDALIVLDQVGEAECGVVTAKIREALSQWARRYPHIVFWADSRRYIRKFRHMTIKVNQFEAVGWDDPPPGVSVDFDRLLPAIASLREQAHASIFVTRGRDGMLVADTELTTVPGIQLTGATDPTGAGDSATAGAVLALAGGATLPEAALMGNLVASITIEQLARTGTARPADLYERLVKWQRQQEATGRETD